MDILSKKLIRVNIHLQLFGLSTGKYTVYALVCIKSGLMYVGFTTSTRYKKRITEHRTALKRAVHNNKLLQDVFDNSTLVAYKIAQTDNKQHALMLEQFCILHSREGLGLGLNLKDNERAVQSLLINSKTYSKNKSKLRKISKRKSYKIADNTNTLTNDI